MSLTLATTAAVIGDDVALELKVLGEVGCCVDDRPVDLGHLRQRCVLAVLAVEANRTVSVDQLIDRVWGDRRPREARNTLYSYLARLRRALVGADDVAITRRSAGYELTVDPALVDFHLFHDLLARARAAVDDSRACALFAQALDLWQGEAFTAMDKAWFVSVRAMLEQKRWAATVEFVDLRLRRGEHADLLPTLSAMAQQHPLDERLAAQLLLALYRSGRQADALHHYERIRARLADELGQQPMPELKQLHQQLLTADRALSSPSAAVTGSTSVPVPHQLPAPSRVFSGRATELALLDKLLDQSGEPGETTQIIAIGGPAGIGKTALAVQWAHQHGDRFPDGHLFVNLRGFDPTAGATPPARAVRGFLDALGADPGPIPADLDAQTGLYRSLVAGKRMLVVLDNASDSAQVMPLLPGTPTCTVLITSRHRLAGIAIGGAYLQELTVITDGEARDLLAAHLGEKRLAAEPAAVSELVAHCAGLPLALSIVAARAASRPDFPLTVLADELREPSVRLDALDAGELTASVRAVFAGSYQALAPEAAVLFGLMALAPGPDIGVPAAASLTASSVSHTRALLQQLETAHLVHEHTPGRYRMHDLLRLCAIEQTTRELPADTRTAALRRLVDHYLRTAHAGDRLLLPYRKPMTIPPVPGSRPHPLADASAALQWFDAEHPCLLAVHQLAVTNGWHDVVWQLAWTLVTFHGRRGHLHDNIACWEAGLSAAEQLGDPAALCQAHRRLGIACAAAGRYEEALDHLQQALSLAERGDDVRTQADVHRALAWTWHRQGDDRRALTCANNALHHYRMLDDPVGEADALNMAARCQAKRGNHDQARDLCERALTLARQQLNRIAEADAWCNFGYIAYRTGRHTIAVDHYYRTLQMYRDLGDTYSEANTYRLIGEVHQSHNQPTQARLAWQHALALYREQNRHDDAEQIQRQLAALTRSEYRWDEASY